MLRWRYGLQGAPILAIARRSRNNAHHRLLMERWRDLAAVKGLLHAACSTTKERD